MILLIANSRDFATDYVIAELRRRSISYLRLDTDLLHEDAVALDPRARCLYIRRDGIEHRLSEEQVQAVLYRAPTHLSESSAGRHTAKQQLARHQWAVFVRSLVVFENARWINHPQRTYLAENKPFQLAVAASLGFDTPHTLVSNTAPDEDHSVWAGGDHCALKALDTFLVRDGESDLFLYTQRVVQAELLDPSLRMMPVILQNYLSSKIDLRVTVVGDKCFPVEIRLNGAGIEGDWRVSKSDTTFQPVSMPAEIADRCVALVRRLGLVFGAIDLARVGDDFYFLEVNPTGEWAWLVDTAAWPLDKVLTDALLANA